MCVQVIFYYFFFTKIGIPKLRNTPDHFYMVFERPLVVQWCAVTGRSVAHTGAHSIHVGVLSSVIRAYRLSYE